MHNTARCGRRILSIGALIVSVALVGCGAFEESPPTPTPTPSASNLLVDAGFEGLAPAWIVFPPAGAHEISEEQAHGGASSMALHLSQPVPALAATQGLNPAAFPEFLSGYYRVDEWPEGAALQFVVKAAGGAPGEQREVRFLIAGTDTEPDEAVPYVFLSRDGPVVGEWTYFGYPIAQAFAAKTGAIPQAWTSIDVSLEAWSPGETVDATAYYDDMYVGPQVGNPNRPKESTK
jgi:hypothetical protein